MMKAAVPVLAVRDVAVSRDFYCNQLGFVVSFEYGRPTFYVSLCRDQVDLHLVAEAEAARPAGQSAACFFLNDVDALHAEFSARGVSVLKPPQNYDYGMREFDLLDPDGNRLIFGTAVVSVS